jgi:hypothetical protein
VIASRADIVDEVRDAPKSVEAFVREWSMWLRVHRDFEDLLAGNLNHAFDPVAAMDVTRARIVLLAAE